MTSRDSIGETMTAVMTLYPRIYFACHTRHVRDPNSGRLLSRHQASILDHLDEIEPTTVMALAGHMGVTPGTMSLALDRLERKGYAVRMRDTKDRRRVHVRLTGAGVRVREASSVLDASRVQALVARLSEPERQQAVEGLSLLARAGQEEMQQNGRQQQDERQQQDGRPQQDGRRKTEDGRQQEDGRQRQEDGRQRTEDGRQRTEDGKREAG